VRKKGFHDIKLCFNVRVFVCVQIETTIRGKLKSDMRNYTVDGTKDGGPIDVLQSKVNIVGYLWEGP